MLKVHCLEIPLKQYSFPLNDDDYERKFELTCDYVNATYTNATATFAALAGRAWSELRVGDIIVMTNNTPAVRVSIVRSIVDNNSFVVAPALGVDQAAGIITKLEVYNRRIAQSAHQLAATTASIKIKIKPFFNLPNNAQLLPLLYLKNLQLVLTL